MSVSNAVSLSDPLVKVFVPALVEALGVAIEPAIEAALARVLPEAIRRAATPEYQSREEAASYVGRSARTLDRLRAAGTLAYTKRGGRVLYATVDLDAYLAAGLVPARRSSLAA